MEEVKKMTDKLEQAGLAGGCFWGMQDLIGKLTGVVRTRVGNMGGDERIFRSNVAIRSRC